MSIGSPIIRVRFPDALYARLLASFERSQAHKSGDVQTLSDFIRKCVREVCEKTERSQRARAKKKASRQKE